MRRLARARCPHSEISAKTPANWPIQGGTPVRAKPWPTWPVWDRSAEEPVLAILRSGNWYRGQGKTVTQFEEAYAKLLGAKRCVAMVNGTNSLLTALHMLDVGVGDEVIVSPYTFIATYNVVLKSCALPVFADTDPETFQINPDKIEERITENTRAILPVHILGIPANMDRINEIAKKHNLKVIEDACQAWLAQWRGKSCGTTRRPGLFQLPELQASALRRRRGGGRQRRRADGQGPLLPQLRPALRQHAQDQRLPDRREQPPDDRVPGGDPALRR